MNKVSILLISSLLLLSACTGETQVNNNNAPSPTPPTQPVPSPEAGNNNSPSEVTANNVVGSSGTVSGLIPSTKPQQRLNQINQGKGDPFGNLRPPAVVKVNSQQELASSLKDPSRTDAIVTGTGGVSGQNKVALLTKPLSNQAQGQSSELEQSKILEPLDAQRVVVSGILNLRGENVAIVKTPWDAVTRSVRVGETISNPTGDIRLRVQKISFDSSDTMALRADNQIILSDIDGSGGIVVLEQYGKLVTREVAQQQNNEAQLEEL